MSCKRVFAIGVLDCLILAGCGGELSDSSCWQDLRTKHAQFYFAIDPDHPRVSEIDESREQLRVALSSCSPDTRFAAYSSGEDQAIESYITLLDLAIFSDDVDLTESFFKRLESDPSANIEAAKLNYGGLRLQTAAFAESSNVVSWLLDQGVDPNEPDDAGLTPLHASHARTEGGLLSIKSLVEHGADIERSVGNGFTPLMLGRQRGDLGKVQCLISLGAQFPENSDLTEVRGPLANHTNIKAVDDFLTSTDRRIPERIRDICYR